MRKKVANFILLDLKRELSEQKKLLSNVLENDEKRDELLLLLVKEISLLRMEIENLEQHR